MAVKEELLKLADRIKATSMWSEGEFSAGELLEIAAELRGIAKAMPDESVLQRMISEVRAGSIDTTPDIEVMKAKARMTAQAAARAAAADENNTPKMVICIGGPAEGVTVPISPHMEEGNYTAVAGARYQLVGGSLSYVPWKKQ